MAEGMEAEGPRLFEEEDYKPCFCGVELMNDFCDSSMFFLMLDSESFLLDYTGVRWPRGVGGRP
jgi:hypothetical protein